MKKRIFCILMAILLCASMFAGCSQSDREPITSYTAPDTDTKAILKILSPTIEKQAAISAKTQLYEKYPNVTVEIDYYNSSTQDTTELEKLQVKQMTGDGADIVIMDAASFSRICDYNKVQQSGAYVDLAQYFDHDPDWNWEGYSKAVIDGMKQGNKLYLLPLYYNMIMFVTTDELLVESGIDLEKCKTGIGLMNEIQKCGERLQAAESEYTVTDFNMLYNFADTFHVNPVHFSEDGGKVVWTEEFDEVLKAYDAAGQVCGWFPGSPGMLYSSCTPIFTMPIQFIDAYRSLQMTALQGKKPVILPVYTANGSGITAQAVLTASVSSSCKNKALGYEFVKCLLSEEAQNMEENGIVTNSRFLPVNKAAVEDAVSTMKFDETITDASGKEEKINDKEYVDQIIALSDQVVYTYQNVIYNWTVSDYFWAYFIREKSLEDCYEDAKSKLEIYVSE